MSLFLQTWGSHVWVPSGLFRLRSLLDLGKPLHFSLTLHTFLYAAIMYFVEQTKLEMCVGSVNDGDLFPQRWFGVLKDMEDLA